MLRKCLAFVLLSVLVLCACEPIPQTLPGEIGQTLQWQDFAYRIEQDLSVTILLYRGKDARVTVPAEIEGLAVKTVGNNAFHGKQELEQVIIPEGVTSIGEAAFTQCHRLTSVQLPSTLQSIGSSAFNRCEKLVDITLPQGLVRIGDLAFLLCESLAEITLPSTVTELGGRVFDSTAFLAAQSGHVVMGDFYVRYVGEQSHIQLPQGIKHIAGGALMECKSLVQVTIPEGVTDIGDMVFYECRNIERIDFPASLQSVGSEGFVGCSLLHYTAPAGSWAEQYANGLGIPVFNDAK